MSLFLRFFSPLIVLFLLIPAITVAADPPKGVSLLPPPVAEAPKVQEPAAAPPQAATPATAPTAVPSPTPETVAAKALPVRIGYVDILKVGEECELGKKAKKQVKIRGDKIQSQLESRKKQLEKQLEKQRAAIESQISSLTPPQREAKAKEFQKKVDDFQKYARGLEKELMTMQEELTSNLFKAIEEAANEYGRSNGLALVVIKRELLYLAGGVDAVDITAPLIKIIDEKTNRK